MENNCILSRSDTTIFHFDFLIFNLFLHGLWPLVSIQTSTSTATFNALRVINAAYNVITNTRQVFHTATTNKHDGMLLKIVAFSRNVGDNFHAIAKAHFGDLAQSGVRFFGCAGIYLSTHTSFKRCSLGEICFSSVQIINGELQGRHFGLAHFWFASFTDHLVSCRHNLR